MTDELSKNQTCLQQQLSHHKQYILNMLQIKSHSIKQQAEDLVLGTPKFNHIREVINTVAYIHKAAKEVYGELGLLRLYQVVHKVTLATSSICLYLTEALQNKTHENNKQLQWLKNGLASTPKSVQPALPEVPDSCPDSSNIECKQLPLNKRRNKLGGVYLYNSNYTNKLQKQVLVKTDARKPVANCNSTKEVIQDECTYFKNKIYKKIYHQLQTQGGQVYVPEADQISTFLILQRKYLQNFNHFSAVESLETSINFFRNSHQQATAFLSHSSLTEEVNTFKLSFAKLMLDLKNKKQQREQTVGKKLGDIKEMIVRKNKQGESKLAAKLMACEEQQMKQEAPRLSVETQTYGRQFQSIKLKDRVIDNLKQKLLVIQETLQNKYKQQLMRTQQKCLALERKIVFLQIKEKQSSLRFSTVRQQPVKKTKMFAIGTRKKHSFHNSSQYTEQEIRDDIQIIQEASNKTISQNKSRVRASSNLRDSQTSCQVKKTWHAKNNKTFKVKIGKHICISAKQINNQNKIGTKGILKKQIDIQFYKKEAKNSTDQNADRVSFCVQKSVRQIDYAEDNNSLLTHHRINSLHNQISVNQPQSPYQVQFGSSSLRKVKHSHQKLQHNNNNTLIIDNESTNNVNKIQQKQYKQQKQYEQYKNRQTESKQKCNTPKKDRTYFREGAHEQYDSKDRHLTRHKQKQSLSSLLKRQHSFDSLQIQNSYAITIDKGVVYQPNTQLAMNKLQPHNNGVVIRSISCNDRINHAGSSSKVISLHFNEGINRRWRQNSIEEAPLMLSVKRCNEQRKRVTSQGVMGINRIVTSSNFQVDVTHKINMLKQRELRRMARNNQILMESLYRPQSQIAILKQRQLWKLHRNRDIKKLAKKKRSAMSFSKKPKHNKTEQSVDYSSLLPQINTKPLQMRS